MKISQLKNYGLLLKVERHNKSSLHILLLKELQKDKQRVDDELKNNIKLNELEFKSKSRKKLYFSKIPLSTIFLRIIHTDVFSIKDADI